MNGHRTGRILCAAAACLLASACAQADTAAVTRGELVKTVFGAGTILALDQTGVYAQTDARVSAWFCAMGDEVRAGDILMRLENDELADNVAQLEYDIQLAQKDVLYTKTHSQYRYQQARDEDGELRFDVNTGEPLMEKYSNEITIRAPSDGRIMAIYIKPGDDALAVYREHGCVAMLSTDGRMKVELTELEPGTLDYGEQVRVVGEDFETTGHVVSLSRRGMQAVIQVESDAYPMDAPVSVEDLDGGRIGTGKLAINKPMAVSAYGGTVKGLPEWIQVGKTVKRYDVMARIHWDQIPLYLDNDEVQREYVKTGMELEQARRKLEQLAVVAPCDGTVISVDVEKGDSVSSGTRLITLLESDTAMQLILKVDELDIVSVEPGQGATLHVDALPDVTLQGTVKKIAPLGSTEEGVTQYDVYIELCGDVDNRVLSGMNVTGEIRVAEQKDALLVPSEALHKDLDGWYVRMEDGSSRRVEIGWMADTQVQILSGLSEGERILRGE